MGNNSKQYKVILLGIAVLTLVFFALGFLVDRLREPQNKREISKSVPVLSVAPTPLPPVKVSCPVAKESCQKGKEVNNGGAFYGFSFDLPLNSKILAAIPGKLIDESSKTKENLPVHAFIRDDKGNEASYYFYGKLLIPSGASVKKGDPVGTIGEGFFPASASFTVKANFIYGFKINKAARKSVF